MKLKDFQELRISVFLCPRATYITNFTRSYFLIAGGEKEWMRLAETLDAEEQTKEQDTNKTDGVGEGGSQDV